MSKTEAFVARVSTDAWKTGGRVTGFKRCDIETWRVHRRPRQAPNEQEPGGAARITREMRPNPCVPNWNTSEFSAFEAFAFDHVM